MVCPFYLFDVAFCFHGCEVVGCEVDFVGAVHLPDGVVVFALLVLSECGCVGAVALGCGGGFVGVAACYDGCGGQDEDE